MSEDGRPGKRARVDEEHPPTPSGTPLDQLICCEEFWLEDGNLVLIAQDTAFRVYRQLLASQSPIFADMFASSSAEASETLDGCSAVRLSDSPQDLVHLLRVLLPRKRRSLFHGSEEAPMTINQISSITRLAHKYDIEDVQRQALAALKTDLTDYDRFCHPKGTPAVLFEGEGDCQPNVPRFGEGQASQCAIGIVNLARLTDTPSLLPAALYICSNLGDAVLDGWTREDGTTEYLNEQDLRLCINGRYTLAKKGLSMVSHLFGHLTSDACRDPSNCHEKLRRALADVVDDGNPAEARIMLPFDTFLEFTQTEDSLCDPCEEEMRQRIRDVRREAWRDLPWIFRLRVEGWNIKVAGNAPAPGQT